MDFISMGEMLIDFTPTEQPFTYTANPGGAPANVAIAAARNGIDTSFLGVLGNDDFGRRLADVLRLDGVKLLGRGLTDDAVTTLAFVTLSDHGERSFTFARKPGADILLQKADVREEDIDACRLLHAGSVSLSDEPSRSAIFYAMELAHKKKKLVSFDVNYREMIWHDMKRCKREVDKLLPFVDFMKISDEELFFVGGEEKIPSFMKENGIAVLVETLGARGAKFYFDESCEIVESRKVKAIDATGAGDAFWGGFLSKLLLGGLRRTEELTREKIADAVLYGNVSGGLCVQRMGGIPAIPTRKEIEEAQR